MAVVLITWSRCPTTGQHLCTTSHLPPEDYYSDLKADAAEYAIGWREPRYPMPAVLEIRYERT